MKKKFLLIVAAMLLTSSCSTRLPKDIEQKINTAYFGNDAGEIKEYFGKYNDSYAVFFGEEAFEVENVERIEDYLFIYHTAGHIYLYYDNDLHRIKEAYDEKVIDIDDVKSIHDKWTNYLIENDRWYDGYKEN